MNKLAILHNHLEFKKTSVNSKDKLKDIERYLGMFLNSSKKPLDKFGEEEVIRFLNSLNYSIRTTNDIKNHIKVFIKWYYPDWSLRFRNLDKLCKQQKPEMAYQPEQMISIEEFKKLVETENNLMWKTYWLVLFYGGFRPSECCKLKWENVFFESKGVVIKLHATKTNKDFYKALPEESSQMLGELKRQSHSDFLFPSPFQKNDCIRSRSVCSRLKRLSQKAIGREVVPYAVRHSIATILYNDKTKDDDDVAHQLGHTKNMKQVYTHLNSEQIKDNVRSLFIQSKPLTKEERDRLKVMTNSFSDLMSILVKNKVSVIKDQEDLNKLLFISKEIKRLQEFN